MSIAESLQNASEALKEGSNAMKVVWSNDRTSLLVVIFCIFVFVAWLFFYAVQAINTIQTSSAIMMNQQRNDFLKYMENRDTRAELRDAKISDALNKNTEAFLDLKAKLSK